MESDQRSCAASDVEGSDAGASPLDYPTEGELARTHPPAPFERIWKAPEELCAAEHTALVRYVGSLLPVYELPAHLSEDVVQDAWAALIRQWDGVDRPLPWMYAVVKKIVHRHAEAAARRRRILDSAAARATFGAPTPTVERETVVELYDVLRSLPQQERAALVLSVLGDQKGKEVAETMGISENTVGVHAHRARKKLRRMLEGIGTLVLILGSMLNIPLPVRHANGFGPSNQFAGESDVTVSSSADFAAAAPGGDADALADGDTDSMAVLRAKAAQYDKAMKKPNLSGVALVAVESSPERFVELALMRIPCEERAAILTKVQKAMADSRAGAA